MKFKLNAKTKKAIRGSISILMVIILLPMMTFSAVIVDTSRINMAKEMMSSAGDLTMNTALANYDTILKDVYGLFAMSQEKDEATLQKELTDYFADTISGYGVIDRTEAEDYVGGLMGDFDVLVSDTEAYQRDLNNLLELNVTKLEADRIDASALANSSILRNQIIEYMKFRAPLEFGMSFIDALKSFQVADDQMEVVKAQVKAQEATEEVTDACSKLINLIREYDRLAMAINSEFERDTDGTLTASEWVVRGNVDGKSGTFIEIKDYDTQVEQYLSGWGANYTHINKLLMVFLAKTPPVDNVYLAKLNYAGGEYFIDANATKINHANSGINVSVTLSGTTDGAKQQVNDQLAAVDALTLKGDAYPGLLKEEYINTDRTAFVNEEEAIKSFISYELFLTNKAEGVKYQDITPILDKLYVLARYFENYDSQIAADISKASGDVTTAKGVLQRITNTIDGMYSTQNGYVTGINDTAEDYVGDELDLSILNNASVYKTTAKNLLENELPALSGDYQTYYNTNLAASGNTNKYLKLYNDIATKLKSSGSSAEKDVAEAALGYQSSEKDKTLSKYFDKEVSLVNKISTGDLRDFFICLETLSQYAEDYKQGIADYNEAVEQKESAAAEVERLEGILEGLRGQRQEMTSKYKTRLDRYREFVKAYQRDAYIYSGYIATATAVVDQETKAIKEQFGKICTNIDALTAKLDEIYTQADAALTQINSYKEKLGDWKSANETYEDKNNADSFSKQTQSDIETAESNYNADSLQTFMKFIKSGDPNSPGMYERFNEFKTYLHVDTHFMYGGKRLHEIGNHADAKQAASRNIESISEEVITTDIAATSLSQLFRGGNNIEFKPYTLEIARKSDEVANTAAADEDGQICFLEPSLIQIQFLKYLNSAYPASVDTVEIEITEEDGSVTKVNPEDDYNKQKEDLKTPDKSIDDMGKEDDAGTVIEREDGKKTDKYGYSYKYVGALTGTDDTDRPSKNKVDSSSAANSAFALSEGEGSASQSVDNQGAELNNILKGLGDAVTAGIENAYILTYLFENFSYNTMIQDAIMDGEKLDDSGTSGTTLTAAKELLKGDTLNKYKDSLKTLSGITKRADNNHFYGAEIEYLMYGNANPATNVTAAKASIYAIRFCFNCIFAFTDSEIRNTTMAAGMAVQAATLGIVPYQVVQIVLQLALAAAESAVDLDMMMSGVDVAIVKTKDTWMLSVSSAVKTAGAFVAQTAAKYAEKAINAVAGGLQKVVDATADELIGAVDDLKDDIKASTEQAVTDVVDQVFGIAMNEIEAVLNRLQYEHKTGRDAVISWVNSELAKAQKAVEDELQQRFGASEIGSKVLDYINGNNPNGKKYIDEVFAEVRNRVDKAIPVDSPAEQAIEEVLAELNDIKMTMINKATSCVEDVLGQVSDLAKDTVTSMQNDLDKIISDNADKLANKATKEIQEKISDATNNFMENTLSKVDTTVDGGSGPKSLASIIKFGYKEYMMLFVYIAICAGGTQENNKILLRTADLIQLNINHAGTASSFKHNKGADFRMKDACTYISINAEADLDMFFMKFDLFSSVVEDQNSDDSQVTVETDNNGTKIYYKGILGY